MAQFDIESMPTVKAKGPESSLVPGMEVEVYLRNQTGGLVTTAAFHAQLHILGSPISAVMPDYQHAVASNEPRQARFFFPLPTYILQAVEARRVDDVSVSLSVRGSCQTVTDPGGKVRWGEVHANFNMDYSQKKWLDLLATLGYRERWVIEIDRPHIEGFDKVAKHVETAADALERRSFDAAVHDCRVAWDALDPLLNALEKDMDAVIDRNSAGQKPKYPDKSERITTLRKSIDAWSQIGAHKEAYVVTAEDAMLCFRLTVSMFSYLSHVASSGHKP